MTVPRFTDAVALDLSLGEAWLVHHALLDLVGLGSPDGDPVDEVPRGVVSVLVKLEDGSRDFTPMELRHIRAACGRYTNRADGVATADRIHAAAVVHRIDDVFFERLPPVD